MRTDSTELSSPTGIYSDREIAAALAGGHIVCDPAPARINGSSVDVTLGYYFYRVQLLGYTLNSVTLLGLTLVIGILVDDTIVEIENIENHSLDRKSVV